ATKNKLHGEETLGIPSKFVYRSLKRDKKHLDKELAGIEERLLELVKQEQQRQLTLLQTVPGIGTRTALFLIVVTDGFSRFETGAQLCSYVGITPTIGNLEVVCVVVAGSVRLAIRNFATYYFFAPSMPVSTTKDAANSMSVS